MAAKGYDLEVDLANVRRTAAQQLKLKAERATEAGPEDTWHLVGAAIDFRVFRNGVHNEGRGGGEDRGDGSGNPYYGLLRDVALQNGLFNGVADDAGHFQPVEFSLARRGQSVADFSPASAWVRNFRVLPLPSRDVVPPNESRVPISTPGFVRPAAPPVAPQRQQPPPPPRLRPAGRDPIGGLIESLAPPGAPPAGAPRAIAPGAPPPRPNLRPRASLDQGEAVPSFDDRVVDDRLAELRRFARERPGEFTRDMEAEHIRLIEAQLVARRRQR